MEEIDDMHPHYVDFVIENLLSPHIALPTKGLRYTVVNQKLLDILGWLRENCEADCHADFYVGGCWLNGARKALEEDCIITFFEYKSDLVAFKMVWGDGILV